MPLGDPTGKRKRPTGGPGSRDAGPLDREPRGERVNLKEINAQANKAASLPFAKFFKKPGEEDGSGAPDKVAAPKPASKKKPKHVNVKWTPNAAAEAAEEAKGSPSPDAPKVTEESNVAEGKATTEGSTEEKS